jgi:pimeloyl-ACP methyl ester carboxylesterase
MATYVLIHGSGDSSWYWHLLAAELRERGHDVVAPDLPIEDETAGLWQYADAVVEAIGDRRDLVVVAQSAGAFTAPLVYERVPADLLVLLAGMVPLPGEPPDDWSANTGCEQARREQDERDGRAPDDMIALFMQDVPPDLATEAFRRERHQSETPGRKPWPLAAWPNVPTRFLLCRDDRLFPADFMRRVVRERLGITPDEIDGSHCVALSRPGELADRLESYRAEL